MTDPQSVSDVIYGVSGLLTLIGVPAAAIAAPLVQLISGILGFRRKPQSQPEWRR